MCFKVKTSLKYYRLQILVIGYAGDDTRQVENVEVVAISGTK